MKKFKLAVHYGYTHHRLWALYNRHKRNVKNGTKFAHKKRKKYAQCKPLQVKPIRKKKKIISKVCDLCKKEFKGKNKSGLYNSHMCFHFQKRLLMDLPESSPPFKCPIDNCDYESHIKCNWIIHYGIEHKLQTIMQDQDLDRIAIEIAESKNNTIEPVIEELEGCEQSTYPQSPDPLYENVKDKQDFFRYIGLEFDEADVHKAIPENKQAVED